MTKYLRLAIGVLLCFSTFPAVALKDYGPWGMKLFEYTNGILRPTPIILEGRGPTKAAWYIFVTSLEKRAPIEIIDALVILRQRGFPIHGLWIEQQHDRFAPQDLRILISYAHSKGFQTIVRIESATVENIQGHIDTGVQGIIIPVVENPSQIVLTLDHAYYLAWRQAGFGRDLQYLLDVSPERRRIIDKNKIVAFMIESKKGVENIADLVRAAKDWADSFGWSPEMRRHIVFWLGPYDYKLDMERYTGVTDTDKLKEYWNDAIKKIAPIIRDAGFSIGGHMKDVSVGHELMTTHGLSIFTVPGGMDSVLNPDAVSLPYLFSLVPGNGGLITIPDSMRLDFLQDPTLTTEEKAILQTVAACLNDAAS